MAAGLRSIVVPASVVAANLLGPGARVLGQKTLLTGGYGRRSRDPSFVLAQCSGEDSLEPCDGPCTVLRLAAGFGSNDVQHTVRVKMRLQSQQQALTLIIGQAG